MLPFRNERLGASLLVVSFLVTSLSTNAFVPRQIVETNSHWFLQNKPFKVKHHFELQSTNAGHDDGPLIGFEKSCLLTDKEVAPILRLGGAKEKVINAFGFYTAFVTLITAPFWGLAMFIVDAVCNAFPDLDPKRKTFDWTGKVWSKTWLALSNSTPSVSGDVELLKDGDRAYLFVANHGSWLDIPVLCTVLDTVFKFIAKGELRPVPFIGQQLIGGNHILIDREDRRSQLRTFKEGMSWLNNGVPLMAFPEGKRSPDGKLMSFKGGIFSMAVKCNAPIVPISISNTHAVMPANSFFPVQSGAGKLHIHVHPPIEVEGTTDKELEEHVRAALLSKMPLEQHPEPELLAPLDAAIPEETKETTEKDSLTI